ncbi:hypothetical protein DFH09DRAFT_1373939 [Mycena vulgaris]|nr:hypothetical protein DFH09DRAFT_1373939 [Mycena vulgaris]
MPAEHTPDDQRLIDSLPTGIVTAFRSSIYQSAYVASNAHLFVNHDWIDARQLRAFLKMAPHPESGPQSLESPPPRVKLEYDVSETRLSAEERVTTADTKTRLRTRTLTEGSHEVIEILSDSEMDTPKEAALRAGLGGDSANGMTNFRTSSPLPALTASKLPRDASSAVTGSTDSAHGTTGFRTSSPLPPSDFPSDTSYAVTDLDNDSSDESDSETHNDLHRSDTLWQDPGLSSEVRIGEFRVTQEVTVQRLEYLTALPSIIPIPEIPTGFVIDLHHPKFDIRNKHGKLRTVDALIKNADNDSWKGNTGTGDSRVMVTFGPGEKPICCRRSRLQCKGAFVCERIDERLLNVVRRDLDPASRDAVFAAQRQTRSEEGTTAERRVTEFLQVIRTQKCSAVGANGVRCDGVPILKTKKQTSRGHDFYVACSGSKKESKEKHRSWAIPDDVDEALFVRGFTAFRGPGDRA